MQTTTLGPYTVSRLSYGCMRLAWQPPAIDQAAARRGIEVLETAMAAGYTFYDHADIYGRGACETIFGNALKENPDWREKMTIATKCGIRPPTEATPHCYDFSRDHIIRSVEGSLERLGIDSIDLLMLHRPDFLADPAEIAATFDELHSAGKVREFGVSNFRPSLVTALAKVVRRPLRVHQVEIHPYRLDCLTDGTLDQCLELGITPMAWSPLAKGRVGTGFVPPVEAPDHAHQIELLAVLDQLAANYETDRSNIVLAWLLRHPARIVPVIGTVTPERIQSAVAASGITLAHDDWYRILRAARGEGLP